MAAGGGGGAICAHKDLHVGPTLVAMAMTFGLGAEIQSPICLFLFLLLRLLLLSDFQRINFKTDNSSLSGNYYSLSSVNDIKSAIANVQPVCLGYWTHHVIHVMCCC